jgi:DHA1 family bicyclomycin/chloramphenicol resistance-like MFS transporter
MSFRIPKGSALVIAALLLLEIFCWIEVDLYAPSFPQIRRFFGTTEEMIQWTLSLNFLGYFLSSLMVGPLADSLGRRPVVLGGAALFILGSLLCVAAPDLATLFAGRVIQGVGVSAPTTLAVTIVADVHDGARQARINAVMNSVVTVTMAAAPMAGAWLSERCGWRSNFMLIFAGALASTALIFVLVPETLGREKRQPFVPARILGNYGQLLRSPFFLSTALGSCACSSWASCGPAPASIPRSSRPSRT